MNSLFQNNYESENDKRLDKKFSYNYSDFLYHKLL